jgi:hypothetical protein
VYEGDRDLPLREAVQKYFLLNSEGPAVHRVAVFDSSGAIEYVISQMDIMQFVHALEKDASWMDISLKELGVPTLLHCHGQRHIVPHHMLQRVMRKGSSCLSMLMMLFDGLQRAERALRS